MHSKDSRSFARPEFLVLRFEVEVIQAIKILGTDLTGATSVSFNGTPAVFKVVPGGSEIRTKIAVRCNHRYRPSDNTKGHAPG
jgi:hypothetical protein